MRYNIISKNYYIDLSNISEGYLFGDNTFYAKSRNDAKMTAVSMLESNNFTDTLDGSEITYLTVKVYRNESEDLIDYDGKLIKRYQLDKEIEREKLISKYRKEIKSKGIKYCYIKKGCRYYLPESSGYSEYKTKAGVFDVKYGISEVISCDQLTLEFIDIDQHNELIQTEIKELSGKLI